MSDAELTPEIQKFIAQYIESVEKLEILLLLSRSPDKTFSIQDVYQQIQSSIPSVTQKLKDLMAEGLVQRQDTDSFRYHPKSSELRNRVADLDAAYQKRRVKVIESIFSKATEELRRFANAFRIRKEDE